MLSFSFFGEGEGLRGPVLQSKQILTDIDEHRIFSSRMFVR